MTSLLFAGRGLNLSILAITLAVITPPGLRAQNSCPVTRAPERPFTPPVPAAKPPGYFYLGTRALFIALSGNPWTGLPRWETGYRNKVVWWSEGYDWKAEPVAAIEITGRRLDAPAPPLVVTGARGSYTNDMGSFIMSGVNFPTAGCWEITGRRRGATLTFVVSVEK